MSNASFSELMAYERQTQALGQVAGRLGWDQETMMPQGAGDQRAEEMAAVAAILHERQTSPRVGEWLSKIDDSTLDEVDRAKMRHIRRDYERSTKLPSELAAEIARTRSLAHQRWAEARAQEDVAHFTPMLAKMVDLKRQEGAALADGGDAYDALLQDYEPGASAAELEAMFGALRPRLVALREACLGKPQPPMLEGPFDEDGQMRLSRLLAETFGYDFSRGRIDKAVHPFSSGSGSDVRITTRTAAGDPFNCFYSTIHEVGHACYEQSISPEYALTPLGRGVSMGVHESQSRIYENQLGRSRAFTGWLYERMRETFGEFGIDDADTFYRTVNQLKDGYIRTEADEVQYNLHVLLRFDLERDLIAGRLEVSDLEEAWNTRFASDFGYEVDKPSNGCLQDVHWSEGLFGYFPTYTLGNVYAGCLMKALQDAVPQWEIALSQGDLSGATSWLRDAVQVHGGLFEPRDVIAKACASDPSEGPLLDYLESKFGDIYNL